MTRFDWRRLRRPTTLLGLALAIAVGVSIYFALRLPAQAAQQALEQGRQDNVTLCTWFRGADRVLGKVNAASPKTTTGSTIVDSLSELQALSRDVADSRICPPPKGSS